MIVCIGDLLLDIFLLSALRQEEQAEGIVLRPGGSAANTAAWAARLGTPSALVACVGADSVGSVLVSQLEHAGVTSRVRRVAGMPTGAVAIEVTDDGERVMRSARGANQRLSAADVMACASARLSAVHVTGYALLGPRGMEVLGAAGDLARRAGAQLSLDPSSCGVIDHVGRTALLGALTRAGVSLLLPNAAEALALSGAGSLGEAADALSTLCTLVAIKDGAQGALVADRGAPVVRVGTPAVHPVDTTGAGDAFNAGALAGLCRGSDLQDGARLGHQAAAQVLRQYGGRPEPQDHAGETVRRRAPAPERRRRRQRAASTDVQRKPQD